MTLTVTLTLTKRGGGVGVGFHLHPGIRVPSKFVSPLVLEWNDVLDGSAYCLPT